MRSEPGFSSLFAFLLFMMDHLLSDSIDGGEGGKDTPLHRLFSQLLKFFPVASEFVSLITIETAMALKLLFKSGPRTMQPDFGRRDTYSEDFGNLIVSKPFQVTQNQNRSVIFREIFHEPPYARIHFFSNQ
jgi:hypothetical protein